MVLVQKWPFFLLFFRQYRPEKCLLRYFKTKKRLSSRKIDIFPKGLIHGFGPKRAIFPRFFFRKYKPGRCVVRYSATASKAIKTKSSKIQNIETFPKG